MRSAGTGEIGIGIAAGIDKGMIQGTIVPDHGSDGDGDVEENKPQKLVRRA